MYIKTGPSCIHKGGGAGGTGSDTEEKGPVMFEFAPPFAPWFYSPISEGLAHETPMSPVFMYEQAVWFVQL
jgi:hypothetical protein